MKKIISIIVPVYNVEEYIGRCIQSLLDQTNTNFEALIVDDGSPDQSIAIAKKMTGEDPRFIFLDKENGGLSSARNYALDHATSDYIAFLDSDDYLSSNFVESFYINSSTNKDIDIFLFGTNIVSESGIVLDKIMPNIDKYYKQKDYLLTKKTIDYSAWSKIYRLSLFQVKRFIDGIKYEDKQIMPSILYDSKLYLIEDYLYNYLQRTGSIMNSYNSNCIRDYAYIYKNFHDFLVQKGLFLELNSYYIHSYLTECYIPIIVNLAKYSPNYLEDCRKMKNQINLKYVSYNVLFRELNIMSKEFLSITLFKVSPMLFRFIFNSYMKIVKRANR